MKSLKFLLFVAVAAFSFSSCTTYSHSMQEGATRIEFHKEDFTLSGQVTAEATSTRILFIDWERLFMRKEGSIGGGALDINLASIPVIGGAVGDKTSNYALYNLMESNTGYDVVFYPQYEKKVVAPLLGIPIYTITTVKVTSRLGKLK